ncbi:MAG: DUF4097 family beta strand repeat-containing protein, partial [Candidatus Latescibacterota bacterium]
MTGRTLQRVLAVLLVVAVGGIFAAHAAAKEVVFEDTFPVKPGGKLKITVSDLDIDLKSGKSDEAVVTVTVTGNIDKMRDRFDKMNFTAELDGNTLVIDTDERSWSTNWWGGSGRGSILLTVVVPKKFDIEAGTSDGDIEAGGFDGSFELKSSDGDIKVDRLEGPLVHLGTSDGDVEVDDIESDDITIRTSDGDLVIGRLVGSSVELKTSDGDVNADMIKAATISARSSDGDVMLTVSGSQLVAKTSDGDLTVVVDGEIALDLTTGDGDITIRAPKDFGAMLDLKGEHVTLGGKVALEGEVSTRRVNGRLGDGGPEVRVRTGDGDITV